MFPAQAFGQELIQNGGFESKGADVLCTATSWTVTNGSCPADYVFIANSGFQRSGASFYGFRSGPATPGLDNTQQVTVARSGPYVFSFYYRSLDGTAGSFLTYVGANQFTVAATSTAYTQFMQTVTLAAGAVNVGFASDPAGTDSPVGIDDVSLRALSIGAGLPPGAPSNATNTASVIDGFTNNGGTLPAGFLILSGLTGTQLVTALDQVSGQGNAAGPAQTSFQAANQFMNLLLDPSIEGRREERASGFADEAMAYAAKPRAREAYAAVTPHDRRATDFGGRWNVWASGYGGTSRVGGDVAAGTQQVTSRIYGTAVGADYRLSRDTLLGFALGGAGTSFGAAQNLGSGRADIFQLGIYGRHTFGMAYVAGALAYSWQDVTTDRTVTVAGTDLLRGRFAANTFAARGELGYRYAASFVGVTPYGALQFVDVRLPSYAESAVNGSNQFALSFANQSTSNLRSELGLRADTSLLMRDGVLTLRGRAAWAHDTNTNRSVTPTFQALPGSSSFTVNGARPAADAALLSAGADMAWHNGWSVAASYDGEVSRTTVSHAGKGTVRRMF